MKKLSIILLIIPLLHECSKHEEKVDIPEFVHQVYIPPLSIKKHDTLKLDIEEDMEDDISFYIDGYIDSIYSFDSTVLIIKLRNGVYVKSISDDVLLSYGNSGGSGSWPLLAKEDLIGDNLFWIDCYTLRGEIRCHGSRGQPEFLGLKKTSKSDKYYGWINYDTPTDSTLTIFELFFRLKANTNTFAGMIDE